MLAAIIGEGPVGEYVAARLRRDQPNCTVIGLRATKPWLEKLFPTAVFFNPLQFSKVRQCLVSVSATRVIFAGNSAIYARGIDTLALRYVTVRKPPRRLPTLWFPHSFLQGITNLLSDLDIQICDALDFVPELRAPLALRLGPCSDYDPALDFQAAVACVEELRRRNWRLTRQAHIVDRGTVLMSERSSTSELLKSFGRSPMRSTATFPVLCRLSAPPFGMIDPPVIGADTISQCHDNGIRAIVVESNKTLVMQREELETKAAECLICIYSVGKQIVDNSSQASSLRAG